MNKEWLNNIKISQELKDKIYYDEKNDLWVISWNAVGESLTPPTADEVCEALSEIEGLAVRYEANSQAFINECEHTLVVMMDSGLLLRIYDTYPANVITLIGRFYEGVEHERV